MDLLPIRREVLDARRQRNISTILLPRPVPLKLAAACAGGALVMLALFLVFGEYTRKVRVTGEVQPTAGALRVVAPLFSRIAVQYVRDGESVKAGQVLFELSGERSVDERITASLTTRRAELLQRRDLTINQLAERGTALATQQQMAEAEIATHRGAIAIEDAQIRIANANVKRYDNLRQKGFVAPAQVEQFKGI